MNAQSIESTPQANQYKQKLIEGITFFITENEMLLANLQAEVARQKQQTDTQASGMSLAHIDEYLQQLSEEKLEVLGKLLGQMYRASIKNAHAISKIDLSNL